MTKIAATILGTIGLAVALTVSIPTPDVHAFKPVGRTNHQAIQKMNRAYQQMQRRAAVERLRNAFHNLRDREVKPESRHNPSWNSAIRWDSVNGERGYRAPTSWDGIKKYGQTLRQGMY